ncbi:MAG TPA: BBP7 family outer membrane beta-barrel protein [Pirellulales bacterium]|nr:BBP7 family outer membrane beta-barrel protein [Pirellulales bacterium]
MQLQRLTLGLVAIVLALAVARPATAQNLQPLGPIGEDVDGQPFAPAELSTYGNGPSLNYGVFFQYDALFWNFSRPRITQVGFPGVGTATAGGLALSNSDTNTNDTSFINPNFRNGNRYELGYIQDNGWGWELSYAETSPAWSNATYQNPTILFADPGAIVLNAPGILAYTFGEGVNFSNSDKLTSIELMRTVRSDPDDFGSYGEFMFGARYFELDDIFRISDQIQFDNTFGDGFDVSTQVKNQLVGPQVGFKWKNVREKWTFGVEARGMIAANLEDTRQSVRVVLTDPLLGVKILDNSLQNGRHDTELAELGELRVESSYELTKAVKVHIEYTAMGVNGISRASERVIYALPNMGINGSNRNEAMFINGVSFGVEINR